MYPVVRAKIQDKIFLILIIALIETSAQVLVKRGELHMYMLNKGYERYSFFCWGLCVCVEKKVKTMKKYSFHL